MKTISIDTIYQGNLDEQEFEDVVLFESTGGFKGDTKREFEIRDSKFEEGFQFGTSLAFAGYKNLKITFIGCYFSKKSKIFKITKSLDSHVIEISFLNCVIEELSIFDSTIDRFLISNCVFTWALKVEKSRIDRIALSNSLGSHTIIDDGNSKCYVSLSDDNLRINRSSKIWGLYMRINEQNKITDITKFPTRYSLENLTEINCFFRAANSDEDANIAKYTHDRILMLDGKVVQHLYYHPSYRDLFDSSIVLHIDQSKGHTKKIEIQSGFYHSVFLKGSSESNVRIEHLRTDDLHFFDFRAKELVLYDIAVRNKQESNFQVVNSYLPQSRFINVDFASFKMVNFYRSDFEDTRFSTCDFPNNILSVKNIYYPHEKEKRYAKLQADLYRQLKNALSKNGNQVEALEMHRRMYHAISQNKTILSRQDRFILLLNRISNAHETSYTRTIGLALLLIPTFWIIFCLSLESLPVRFGWFGLGEFVKGSFQLHCYFINNLKSLFVLANPVHSIGNLEDLAQAKGNELTAYSYFVSFVSRIIVAWLFYQFVTAFRKFGRKL